MIANPFEARRFRSNAADYTRYPVPIQTSSSNALSCAPACTGRRLVDLGCARPANAPGNLGPSTDALERALRAVLELLSPDDRFSETVEISGLIASRG
jgi:hypothetical protein